MMWNITGTHIHMNTRGTEPWAQGSLIPGSNYSAQVRVHYVTLFCDQGLALFI
jgi:hypothetical protein